MFSISEFSRITGMTIKALRLYHEKEILVPSVVDRVSGYRYYSHENVERAYIIKTLRDLEFSLSAIQDIMDETADNESILEVLEKQKRIMKERMENSRHILSSLDNLIKTEMEAIKLMQTNYEVEEKHVGDQLIAGIRFTGKYCDCGERFKILYRNFGWNNAGPCFDLYYDKEYKEADADIESCLPIKKAKTVEGVSIRTLPGGKCVSLIHQGPYDQIGKAYEKLLAYIKTKGYSLNAPTRQIYLKGPGMIFQGNPNNYLTEIQMMLAE